MPINYPGVPIATDLLPKNINEQIAKGPDFSWIGNVPTRFFEGQEAGYKQHQRDIFQQGLPKNAEGNVDWNKAIEQLVQSGGAPAIGAAAPLLKYQILQSMFNEPGVPPMPGPTSSGAIPGGPPSTATASRPLSPPGAAIATPPSTTDQTLTPAQIAAANPQGVPAAVAQPTPPSPPPQQPPSFNTRFQPAVQPGPGPQPQAQPQLQPTQVAQAPPALAPGGAFDPQMLADLQRQQAVWQARGDAFTRRAERLDMLEKGAGDADRAAANHAYTQAQQIQQQMLTSQQPTPEMRNARAAGFTGPMDYIRAQELQKNAVARGEAVFRGITAQASQYEKDLKPLNELATGILNDPRAYTGAGAEQILDWNRIKAIWGDTKAAQLQEMLQKVTAASTLAQINVTRDQMQEAGANSSRIFSSQVDQVVKASPQLETTLAGNRALIAVQMKMGEMGVEMARQAREYRAKHGFLDDGFDQQVSDYLQKHPVFSDLEQSRPDVLGAPTAPKGSAKWTPQQWIYWGNTMRLNPGDTVRISSGRYGTIPSPTVPLNVQ